jgi:hypothetical protein
MAQRAQIAFLHGILGIGSVAEQVAGQRVNVVEIGQRGVAKPPRFVLLGIAAAARPRTMPGCPGHHRVSLRLIEHHCAALLPVAASTTTVPVICGCTEQKYA